ncbi:hypothetical protein [Rhodohalobacter halophilus]|uniref:hypothetical protein n=1 Tax=Rhodohalobacter halophilus TaxID=1812810 RepID=UPI00083F89E9|nr:hypothetical protein [Rhodohalobacter halophilus]
MKTTMMTMVVLIASLLMADFANAQSSRDLQYFRAPDQTGLNVFESPKTTDVEFDGVKVRIGGANTLQFQAIEQDNAAGGIFELGPNFNLATSNLDLDVQLERGLRMHLRTYLSSRHHRQPYVKGGYMQVDRLDFIQDGLLDELMDKVTIKVGHMEINYGDAHFRRTDNGQAIHNPFVGNYIMDAFTTEVGGEIYYQSNGLLAMIGLTNGKLNQSTVEPAPGAIATRVSLVGKLGYDSQVNEDLRVRLTGSVYHAGQSARTYLYAGDRAGSRYYNILTESSSEFRIPRFDPGFSNEMTAIMINPFVKFQGLEFFGVLEFASGKAAAEPDTRNFTQYGAELLYRLGEKENFYLGGRYNLVTGDTSAGEDVDISRINVGGGWFLTKNVLAKVEYVSQKYDGFATGSVFNDAEFNGLMLEAVISF